MFSKQQPNSVLFITLDSCRYDTFLAASTPNLKKIGELHKAMAPANFTFPSHAAMFAGFTPGVAGLKIPYVNPKFGKIFKLENGSSAAQGTNYFTLSGRNIIDGFKRLGYLTLGTGAVSWFDTATLPGKFLTEDFDQFFFAGNSHSLASQLEWLANKLQNINQPVFVFLNVGETHLPYYFEGADWPANEHPCLPFGEANDASKCRVRQKACLEFVDKALEPLLEAFSQATIVTCADHGDCWGEDGLWEHGISHQKVLEVPLLFKLGALPDAVHISQFPIENTTIFPAEKFTAQDQVDLKEIDLEFTGERFIPGLHGRIEYEHLHRYTLSLPYVINKTILDIASGEGYGAALLAKKAFAVTGVDIDPVAIDHSRTSYSNLANLSFIVGSCEAIPLPDHSMEVITSFETIEHHDKHEEMLSEINRVLKPGGTLIISSPNKEVYSDKRNFTNPYHVKELYLVEFIELLKKYFQHVQLYGQKTLNSSLVTALDATVEQTYNAYSSEPGLLDQPVQKFGAFPYFIAICSNDPAEALGLRPNSFYFNISNDIDKEVDEFRAIIEAKNRQAELLEKEYYKVIDLAEARSQQISLLESEYHKLTDLVGAKQGHIEHLEKEYYRLTDSIIAKDQQINYLEERIKTEPAGRENGNTIRPEPIIAGSQVTQTSIKSSLPEILASIDTIKLFVTSAGNQEMVEIAEMLRYGFEAAGLNAQTLIDQIPGPDEANLLQIIVALQEYHPLFLAKLYDSESSNKILSRAYILNVDQPGSFWFEEVVRHSKFCLGVFDISRLGAIEFEKRGIEAFHLPLGYTPTLEHISNYSAGDKSVDIIFIGTNTPKRELFFSENAEAFSAYNCHFILVRPDLHKQVTTPGMLGNEQRNNFLGKSKVLLNLHHSYYEHPYFEWHRALITMANRCLFITEMSESIAFAPLIAGKHFIMAEPEDLLTATRYYLEHEDERLAIVEQAYQFITQDLNMAAICKNFLGK